MDKKKRPSPWLDKKIVWVIVSLLASMLLWVYVTSTEGTEIERTFPGVQVDFGDTENVLRDSKGLLVTNVDNMSVKVTLSGPRSILSKLTASALRANVDLSNISRNAVYSMPYDITFPAGVDGSKITVVSQTPETVIFTVDKITNKTVEVRGNFGGSVAEGYLAEELEMDPATIKIYGSESDLARVAYAWVTFERDDVDSTLTVDLPFALVDEYGKPVETTAGIDSDTDTVSVTLPIKETKEVPLTVTLIEGAGATEVNSVVTITPRTVTLAGDSAILDGINKIVLGTIDLSDFPLTFEDTYSIVIDDDLENLTGETEAKVKVEIKGLVTKRFTVTNISHINLPEGYRAEIVTKSLEVTVRGAQAVIDAIKADHIRAVADLEDFDATTGSVTPPVRVYIDGVTEAQAGALKLNYKVSVNITAK